VGDSQYTDFRCDKHALVLDEIARSKGEDADAMVVRQTIQWIAARIRPERRGRPHDACSGFTLAAGLRTAAPRHLGGLRALLCELGGAGQGATTRPALHAAGAENRAGPADGDDRHAVEKLDCRDGDQAAQALSARSFRASSSRSYMRIALALRGPRRGYSSCSGRRAADRGGGDEPARPGEVND